MEWTTLTSCLGGEPVAGGRMKVPGTTFWTTPNTAASNSSGFAGLAGGNRSFNGSFNVIGNNGYWWSSKEDNTTNAWFRLLFFDNATVNRLSFNKADGFSVRCIRD